jgi:hypothetical protein
MFNICCGNLFIVEYFYKKLKMSLKLKNSQKLMKFRFFLMLSVFFSMLIVPAASMSSDAIIKGKARAANAVTLKIDDKLINLWGVRSVAEADIKHQISARIMLEDLMGGFEISCQTKGVSAQKRYFSQCVNYMDADIGLAMVQAGYAIVERASVFGTVFEEPYISAENVAREGKKGIWSDHDSFGLMSSFMMTFMGVIALIFLMQLGGIVFLGRVVSGGFMKLQQEQAYHSELFAKEQKIKEKESLIVASMLETEIKSNRSKIDAYIVVYSEMLRELKMPGKKPKYKIAGDIIQLQPSLDRYIFDTHTAKIETLGPRISSALVHFYARIKNVTEYANLEPETPVENAQKTIEGLLNNATRLQELSETLIQDFRKYNSEGRINKSDN